MVFESWELDAIEQGVVDFLGGANSQLREPITATLGHPNRPREIYVPRTIREYSGQVWLHDFAGEFPLADTEDTPREDAPNGLFTGYLPAEKLLSGRRKYGTRVYLKWVEGRWQVDGVAGVEAEAYLEGTQEVEYAPIQREQLLWGLLRANEPPDGRVKLVGRTFPFEGTWRRLLDRDSIDLIETYAANLGQGQGRAIQIEMNPLTGAPVYTASDPFTDTSRDAETGAVNHGVVFAHYPKDTHNDLLHYGWVKVYRNIEDITEQDILIAPGEADEAGGGGGDATWLATDTEDFPASPPAGVIGHWNFETGAVHARNGSEPPGWLGPYYFSDSPGGGGGLVGALKMIWTETDVEIETTDNFQLEAFTFRPFDTHGFYNPSFGVTQTVGDGIYQITLQMDFYLADGLTNEGDVTASIAVTLNEDGNTGEYFHPVILPAGSTNLPMRRVEVSVFGRIQNAEEIQWRIYNNTEESIFLDRAEVWLKLLQAPPFAAP